MATRVIMSMMRKLKAKSESVDMEFKLQSSFLSNSVSFNFIIKCRVFFR